jgi:chemotaxis protein histidine kinase CheA
MAEDQLRTIVDGIRTRLQADLDTQLGAIAESQGQALAEARRAAEAAADERWAAKLDAIRDELTARMQAEVAAARSEVERTMVAESMRERIEAEQAAADAASRVQRDIAEAVAAEQHRGSAAAEERVRTQLDQALAVEQERAQQTLETERQRAAHELAEARAALAAARDDASRAVEEAHRAAAASAVASQPQGAANAGGLLAAIREIDQARSLSDALAATVRAAALEAPRVALFIVNGTQLQEWPVAGVPAVQGGTIASGGPDAGLLGDVLRTNEAMLGGRNGGPSAPSFAALPAGRVAVAVPFVLGGRPVAVLYADEGVDGDGSTGWHETVQILGRHAAACLAHLTAAKTAQAMQGFTGTTGAGQAGLDADEEQGARRYARLLVSEIKLYNEAAVRHGRERRDLLSRLKPEIDRAHRLYDERVPPSVQARDTYFQQELVQTLADGDQSLLG